MATFVGNGHRVYVGPLDLSGQANSVTFGPLSRNFPDATTFNDGGFQCVRPGVASGALTVAGLQDFAAGALDSTISVGQIGSQYADLVIPSATGTPAAGDPCWFSRGVVNSLNPLDGAKGDMGKFTVGLAYDTALIQGLTAHPLAARTTTGTGTAVALTGPTAAQSLYAVLHVTAYSGLTNVVFTIESDDNSGFTSAATRVTFATVTGLTSEFKSVVGAFNTETYHRVSWAVTGTGSVSFVCAFGVL